MFCLLFFCWCSSCGSLPARFRSGRPVRCFRQAFATRCQVDAQYLVTQILDRHRTFVDCRHYLRRAAFLWHGRADAARLPVAGRFCTRVRIVHRRFEAFERQDIVPCGQALHAVQGACARREMFVVPVLASWLDLYYIYGLVDGWMKLILSITLSVAARCCCSFPVAVAPGAPDLRSFVHVAAWKIPATDGSCVVILFVVHRAGFTFWALGIFLYMLFDVHETDGMVILQAFSQVGVVRAQAYRRLVADRPQARLLGLRSLRVHQQCQRAFTWPGHLLYHFAGTSSAIFSVVTCWVDIGLSLVLVSSFRVHLCMALFVDLLDGETRSSGRYVASYDHVFCRVHLYVRVGRRVEIVARRREARCRSFRRSRAHLPGRSGCGENSKRRYLSVGELPCMTGRAGVPHRRYIVIGISSIVCSMIFFCQAPLSGTDLCILCTSFYLLSFVQNEIGTSFISPFVFRTDRFLGVDLFQFFPVQVVTIFLYIYFLLLHHFFIFLHRHGSGCTDLRPRTPDLLLVVRLLGARRRLVCTPAHATCTWDRSGALGWRRCVMVRCSAGFCIFVHILHSFWSLSLCIAHRLFLVHGMDDRDHLLLGHQEHLVTPHRLRVSRRDTRRPYIADRHKNPARRTRVAGGPPATIFPCPVAGRSPRVHGFPPPPPGATEGDEEEDDLLFIV